MTQFRSASTALRQEALSLPKTLTPGPRAYRASSDLQLRASYSGTPKVRPLGGTPGLSHTHQTAPARTPLPRVPPPRFAGQSAAPAAARQEAAQEQAAGAAQEPQPEPSSSKASMTDDLLNILRDEAVQKHVGAIRNKAVQHHVGAIRDKALKKLAIDDPHQ